MKLKDIFTSSIFLKSIFALSLFILIFISAVSYKHGSTLTHSTNALVHSYEVHTELELLVSYLKDAETGQRGYIITGDSSFLVPYIGARKKVNKSLYILKKLAGNNLQQEKNIDSLYNLISLRFFYLSSSLNLLSNSPMRDTQVKVSLIQGKKVMDAIRSQTNAMINLEMTYLKEKQANLKHEISFTPRFTMLLLLFSLLVFTVSYFKISNDLVILQKNNAQLLINIESIKHAEVIGNFSTWQRDMETQELIISENQHALLGYDPQEFELTMEKFVEFVHPQDRHLISENSLRLIREQKASTAFFRIYRKDGELRYFKYLGKIIRDIKGKKTLIGINSDITEEYKKSLSLEERNKQLEQSNTELASFNYVASHDLQEPLRIIQIYISRIEEKEKECLTDTGKEYFERIKSSANRMQILINDLLLFSRTNKTDKAFEKADFNVLLQQAEEELSQVIEEKKATIESSELPTLMVIPYQIQQLFINLIGNSLKYTREGVLPLIKISSKTVLAKDYPLLKADPEHKFHKISIEDNGLGFDQNQASNIFVLFKRLHHKTDYPGTGIGLSICKKIVENHSGYIFAEGKPDTGATFFIFLPA